VLRGSARDTQGHVSARATKKPGVSWAAVQRLFLALPGVEEATSYGTPAFKVRGKLLARLREDGEDLVVRVEPDDREMLIAAAPDTFHVTDHYVGYPYLLVRLSRVHREDLGRIAEQAWRSLAPKRMVAARERKA